MGFALAGGGGFEGEEDLSCQVNSSGLSQLLRLKLGFIHDLGLYRGPDLLCVHQNKTINQFD